MPTYQYDAATAESRRVLSSAELIHEQLRDDISILDDEICGLFGQDSRMLLDIPAGPKREFAERDLQGVLDFLRVIQKKYDLEWKPKP